LLSFSSTFFHIMLPLSLCSLLCSKKFSAHMEWMEFGGKERKQVLISLYSLASNSPNIPPSALQPTPSHSLYTFSSSSVCVFNAGEITISNFYLHYHHSDRFLNVRHLNSSPAHKLKCREGERARKGAVVKVRKFLRLLPRKYNWTVCKFIGRN
jgi:hypothetical protein